MSSYLSERHFCDRDTIEFRHFSAMISITCAGDDGNWMQAEANEITLLLTNRQRGDRAALDRLVPLILRELDFIARRHLRREGKDNSVQPSSLVQEAFLRLLPDRDVEWQSRAHFFAVASRVMRHVLVDHAREKRRDKRGGGAVHIPLDAAVILSPEQLDQVVAVDQALERLAESEPRKSRVLECGSLADSA